MNAASFCISALLTALTVPAQASQPRSIQRGSYREELREGLRFIKNDRLMLALMLMIMVTNCIDAAHSSVLMPVYANTILGSPVSLGLMMAAFGSGALIGAAIYSVVAPRLPRQITCFWAFLIIGARLWVMAALPELNVLLVAA